MRYRVVLNKYLVTLFLVFFIPHQTFAQVNIKPQPLHSVFPVEDSSFWRWQITPYLWAAGMKGRISPFQGSPELNVNKSFSEILDTLNIGGFINVWGRYNRFVLSSDLMFVNTTDLQGHGPLPAVQLPSFGVIIPPGTSIDAQVDSKLFSTTLQGGYRIANSPKFTLDVLAGARYWRISTKASVTAKHPAIGSLSARHGEKFDWIDPVVSVRGFLPITQRLSLQATIDIGGFGVGSSHTWSGHATVNYTFSKHLSASTGYKILDVNYSRNGYSYDTRLKGLVVGLTYRF